MATERRRELFLGALLMVLVVVIYRAWTSTTSAPAQTSNESGLAASGAASAGAAQTRPAAPDVHLEALDADRPVPGSIDRNLFRFKPKAPPPPPPQILRPAPVTNPVPPGPPPPPPVPPIALKFIGTLERGGQKLAILSDSSGHVSYGPEGATIDGQYRIIKIGAESVEMSYVDGRGRQMIRKTGG